MPFGETFPEKTNNLRGLTLKTSKKPELLAPCGSYEALEAAIAAGADALYLGTTMLNARMNAKNFDRQSLISAVELAHKNGVSVYVTMNTTVLDRQMKDALAQAEFLYKAGVDALIVADLGFASLVHKYFPDFPLHASTQAGGHNLECAKYFEKLGFSRMVCSRELSRENVKYLSENSPIEIEMFVHGAMCVSFSGQCLLSSFIGGRSGNRGECAQPCRMCYNGRYPLSLKDMCLAGHMEEILNMGVSSLKIEGRMKSPDYVYAVVSTYRKLIDEGRNATKEELAYLADIFSRGGFTDGYFTGNKDKMHGVRSESDKNATARTAVKRQNNSFHRQEIVIPERNHSLPEGFTLTYPEVKFKTTRSARWYKCQNMPKEPLFDINYIPLDKFDKYSANGVLLPPVMLDSELDTVRKKLIFAKEKGAKHAMIASVGQIQLCRELGFVLHGDYRLNITSNATAALFSDFEDILLSPELIMAQVRDIKAKKSVIVYGRAPLMTLEVSCGTESLQDRTKASFPVIFEGGRELVLNSLPTYMADRRDVLSKAGAFSWHFIFTLEGQQESRVTVMNYEKGYPTKKAVRRIK